MLQSGTGPVLQDIWLNIMGYMCSTEYHGLYVYVLYSQAF